MGVKRRVVLLVLLLAASLAVVLVLRRGGWLEPARIGALAVRLRRGHDPSVTAPLFVLAFGGAAAIGVPATPFMLASGVLFGVRLGAALSVVAAVAGGVGGYGVARLFGRGAVDRFVRRHRHLERLLRANAFWTMLRVRLVPVVPLAVGNFVAGVARMPLLPFVAATVLGVTPFAVIYAYLASTLLWGAESTQRHALWNLAAGSLALVAISYLPTVARKVRRSRLRRA